MEQCIIHRKNHFLIHKAGVGLNNGTDFNPGGEGYMRLNVACPRVTLEKALKQIHAAFEKVDVKLN